MAGLYPGGEALIGVTHLILQGDLSLAPEGTVVIPLLWEITEFQ